LSDVADCAVFGIPDEEFGEALAALVQPQPGKSVDKDRLVAHLRGRLATFKVPRLIEERTQLPRDEAGKIRKRMLRDEFWTQAGRRI
jgi:long-chain acyl-CoA synthetase